MLPPTHLHKKHPKPKHSLLARGEILFLKKNTIAAPSAVMANVNSVPLAANRKALINTTPHKPMRSSMMRCLLINYS